MTTEPKTEQTVEEYNMVRDLAEISNYDMMTLLKSDRDSQCKSQRLL